jgi:hypothetical protein
MSEVKFIINVDTINETITLKDNGTNWTTNGSPISLSILLKGENKNNPVVKKVIIDAFEILEFMNAGLSITYSDLFNLVTPVDNFYLVEVVANEGLEDQMLSEKMAVGFTYSITRLVHNATLGVNIPIRDLFESITIGITHQVLELLNILSLEAIYTTDREVKWRKLYNYLTGVVNDLNY